MCILSLATQYPVLWHWAVPLLSISSLTSFIAFYTFTSSVAILLFGRRWDLLTSAFVFTRPGVRSDHGEECNGWFSELAGLEQIAVEGSDLLLPKCERQVFLPDIWTNWATCGTTKKNKQNEHCCRCWVTDLWGWMGELFFFFWRDCHQHESPHFKMAKYLSVTFLKHFHRENLSIYAMFLATTHCPRVHSSHHYHILLTTSCNWLTGFYEYGLVGLTSNWWQWKEEYNLRLPSMNLIITHFSPFQSCSNSWSWVFSNKLHVCFFVDFWQQRHSATTSRLILAVDVQDEPLCIYHLKFTRSTFHFPLFNVAVTQWRLGD